MAKKENSDLLKQKRVAFIKATEDLASVVRQGGSFLVKENDINVVGYHANYMMKDLAEKIVANQQSAKKKRNIFGFSEDTNDNDDDKDEDNDYNRTSPRRRKPATKKKKPNLIAKVKAAIRKHDNSYKGYLSAISKADEISKKDLIALKEALRSMIVLYLFALKLFDSMLYRKAQQIVKKKRKQDQDEDRKTLRPEAMDVEHVWRNLRNYTPPPFAIRPNQLKFYRSLVG